MKERRAKDIMKRNVLAVRDDWSVDRLTEFLVEESISGAPVTTAGGKLVGVVSVTDIVRYRNVPVKKVDGPHEVYIHELDRRFDREDLASFRIGSEQPTTVRDIMTPMVFQVAEDTSIAEVADAMVRGRIHRVFVTRGERVVGIISALDVLALVAGR